MLYNSKTMNNIVQSVLNNDYSIIKSEVDIVWRQLYLSEKEKLNNKQKENRVEFNRVKKEKKLNGRYEMQKCKKFKKFAFSGTIADLFVAIGDESLSEEIGRFIKRFDGFIIKQCIKRHHYLGEEMEDCKQFIKLQMIQAYPKKYKYTNWKKIVRSIIKRKAIDFSKFRNNDIKHLVLESTFIEANRTNNTGEISYTDTGINDSFIDPKLDFDTIDIIIRLKDIIDVRDDIFDEWDVEFMRILVKNVSNKDYDYESLLEKIHVKNGYNAKTRFNILAEKIKELISKGAVM